MVIGLRIGTGIIEQIIIADDLRSRQALGHDIGF